jgi:hypothetical protein
MSRSGLTPVPRIVTEAVNEFLRKSREDAEKFGNVERLDPSQAYSLHRAAAAIYAAGWSDGHDAARIEEQADRDERARIHDARHRDQPAEQ